MPAPHDLMYFRRTVLDDGAVRVAMVHAEHISLGRYTVEKNEYDADLPPDVAQSLGLDLPRLGAVPWIVLAGFLDSYNDLNPERECKDERQNPYFAENRGPYWLVTGRPA